MTKLLKNSKQILAFVFAFAVLAASLFTGNVISADACAADANIIYWDGTSDSVLADADDGSGDGSSWETAIIIDSAAELQYLARTIAGGATGKFYKIKDGIDKIILQPENVVDTDRLLGFTNAADVEAYFASLEGKLDWLSLEGENEKYFNGSFDGNGVEIYGLYCGGCKNVGLFPCVDGGGANTETTYKSGDKEIKHAYDDGIILKNFSVKNAYIYQNSSNANARTGIVVGMSGNSGYGSRVDGTITLEQIGVYNCYVKVSSAPCKTSGIMIGSPGDRFVINNCIIYGNTAIRSDGNPFTVFGSAPTCYGTIKNDALVNDKEDPDFVLRENVVTNTISIGTAPYLTFNPNARGNGPEVFENVYTDAPAGTVESYSYEATEENVDIMQITETGILFAKKATKLDWEHNLFMSEVGPVFRAFHGTITYQETKTTHLWKCEDCGLTSPGGIQNHIYNVTEEGRYICTICDYECKHSEMTQPTLELGDCLTPPGTYTRCLYCDWYFSDNLGSALGHQFTYVPADPGHCAADGRAEYWYCSACKMKYVTSSLLAPYEDAVTDAELNTGIGKCIKAEDENGVVVIRDPNGHYFICKIDQGRLDYECNPIGEDEIEEHDYKNAVCIKCGWECSNHDYELTGNLAVVGDCVTDEEAELRCTICKYKSSVVTVKASHNIVKMDEVLPTDRMEGTKAHYKCTVCKEVYADAEGKTKITNASLIIPKVLPEEYRNMVNADLGSKSPSTSDSLVPVFVTAALAGAALVLTRKFKK